MAGPDIDLRYNLYSNNTEQYNKEEIQHSNFIGAITGMGIGFCVGLCILSTYYYCYMPVKKVIVKKKIKRKINNNTELHKVSNISRTISSCPICMKKYEDNEIIRILSCRHEYHKECVDIWFKNYKTDCPMCRQSALP